MIGYSSMPMSVGDIELMSADSDLIKPWTVTKFADHCWNVHDAEGTFIAYVVTISSKDENDLFKLLNSA